MKKEYMLYIDYMKGIAMILVICSHILSLNNMCGCIASTIHNPAFYFASGILLAQANLKEFRLFIWSKGKRLIYPFMLWSFIFGEIYCLIKDVSLINGLINAVNKLWFLPVLMFAFVMISILDKIKIKRIVMIISWLSLIVVSSLLSSMIGKILFFSFLVYIGREFANIEITKNKIVIMIIIFVFSSIGLFGSGYITIQDDIVPGYKLVIIFAISFVGACMLKEISKVLANLIEIRFLYFIGRNSLYYYVLHYFSLYYMEMVNVSFEYRHIIGIFLAFLIPTLYCLFGKKTVLNRICFGYK